MAARDGTSGLSVDARDKALFALSQMLAARQLAAAAPDPRQQRILARYVLLHADSTRRWLGLWQRDLYGHVLTRPVAQAAATPLRRLRQEWAKQKTARDKLAARRQAVPGTRAVDLRATVEMWLALTQSASDALCDRALAVAKALGGPLPPEEPMSPTDVRAATAALKAAAPRPRTVYTDATSYAAGEPHYVPITLTGPVGQRVMQINDVHSHLEALVTLRAFATRHDSIGRLLRAALIVEDCALVELTIGAPDGEKPARDGPPLVELLNPRGCEAGVEVLTNIAGTVVPEETRRNLRDMRGQVAAHLDEKLSFEDVLEVLDGVDAESLIHLADVVLDHLDAAAARHVDLGLLVIGHRELADLTPASRQTVPAAFAPADHAALIDKPAGAIVGSGFGNAMSARIAGVTAGRSRNPRPRWNPSEKPDA